MALFGAAHDGEGPGEFIAPYGIAVDSRADIDVGEVANTIRGRQLDPPRELKTLKKLQRTSSRRSAGSSRAATRPLSKAGRAASLGSHVALPGAPVVASRVADLALLRHASQCIDEAGFGVRPAWGGPAAP